MENDSVMDPGAQQPEQFAGARRGGWAVRARHFGGCSGANVVIAVTLLYETPSEALGTAGRFALAAPRLAKEIPILRSEWRLWLPEGFNYTDFDSNLGKPEPERESVLIAKFGAGIVGTLAISLYERIPATSTGVVAMDGAILGGIPNAEPRTIPKGDRQEAARTRAEAPARKSAGRRPVQLHRCREPCEENRGWFSAGLRRASRSRD